MSNVPDLFLKDEAEVSVDLPVGKLADPQELFKLAQRWDKVHRVVLFKEDEINSLDIADCFPLPKDGLPFPLPGTDRQILDRQRRARGAGYQQVQNHASQCAGQ